MSRETLLRWMLRLALAAKPPTGFLKDMVLEHSGEHRGTLDIKHGGLLPIVDIARYAGLKAKSKTTSTIERLRAASDAGVLDQTHARTLAEAFDLFMELRVEHQVSQLQRGEKPDDHLDPEGAQLAHPSLPARRVPRGDRGAEEARRGAALAGDQLTPTRSPSAAARAYVETLMPDPSMRWSEVSFAALDFETTGLDPSRDEIISFATIPVEGGRVRLSDSRYSLVRPARMPDGDSIRIHGLRPADLEDAPPLDDELDELLAALTGRVVIAHVAAVERGFLSAALERRALELRNPIVDTAALAAELEAPDRALRLRPGAQRALRAGARVPAAGPSTPPRRRRRAHNRAAVPGAGDPPGPGRAADPRRDAGACACASRSARWAIACGGPGANLIRSSARP